MNKQFHKKFKGSDKSMGSKPGGHIYGLGMIGAAVYYLHTTVGLAASVTGLLKALVWPAFLVYHLLGL